MTSVQDQGRVTIPVAQTALWVAVERIKETNRPDSIHQDPFAEKLVGKEGLQFFDKMQADAPFHSRVIGLRGRLMDDIMVSCVAKYNIKQIINAACGVDTVAWRIAFQPDVTYFELDFPEMLQWKKNILKDDPVKCNYKAVEADLRDPQWPEKLIASGFDPSKPTCWITAGFLPYLPEQAVHDFLEKVNNLSAPGSIYTADLPSKDLMKSKIWQKIADLLEKQGCPIVYGNNNPAELFAQHGFNKVVNEAHFDDMAKQLKIPFKEILKEDISDEANLMKMPVLTVRKC